MIWKRLKKSTSEQEAQFQEQMNEEKVSLKDHFLMTMTAYVMLVLPSILVLLVLAFVMMWIFGLL